MDFYQFLGAVGRVAKRVKLNEQHFGEDFLTE